MVSRFDAAVIGTGQAGPSLANRLTRAGMIPPHLLILGGSYIGLEFAQMFRRFGSKITVVEAAPRLVPREDDDVSDAIRDILEREGITIHLATKCTGLARRGAAIVAQLEAPTGAVKIEATHRDNPTPRSAVNIEIKRS